jgi:hypothetical protein
VAPDEEAAAAAAVAAALLIISSLIRCFAANSSRFATSLAFKSAGREASSSTDTCTS